VFCSPQSMANGLYFENLNIEYQELSWLPSLPTICYAFPKLEMLAARVAEHLKRMGAMMI
jgi:hypothetical protein